MRHSRRSLIWEYIPTYAIPTQKLQPQIFYREDENENSCAACRHPTLQPTSPSRSTRISDASHDRGLRKTIWNRWLYCDEGEKCDRAAKMAKILWHHEGKRTIGLTVNPSRNSGLRKSEILIHAVSPSGQRNHMFTHSPTRQEIKQTHEENSTRKVWCALREIYFHNSAERKYIWRSDVHHRSSRSRDQHRSQCDASRDHAAGAKRDHRLDRQCANRRAGRRCRAGVGWIRCGLSGGGDDPAPLPRGRTGGAHGDDSLTVVGARGKQRDGGSDLVGRDRGSGAFDQQQSLDRLRAQYLECLRWYQHCELHHQNIQSTNQHRSDDHGHGQRGIDQCDLIGDTVADSAKRDECPASHGWSDCC